MRLSVRLLFLYNMELHKQFDRCCNHFGLKDHLVKTGLRKATINIKETLGLSHFYLLCTDCRKKASDIIKQKTNDISDYCGNYLNNNNNNMSDGDGDSDTDITDTQQSLRSFSNNSEFMLSQSSSDSQVSIETRLPVINRALQLLNETPISSKKLNNDNFSNHKVNDISSNLKKSLYFATDKESEFEDDGENFRNLI
ncbi:hypothetical protein ABEB36_013975 [Hypothenemus hampei]|uniref:Uncharacterized protein n=1 Tax=Hypothenemus hampei TaxID=57062 RepID=A0ABD1E373_HYPHA